MFEFDGWMVAIIGAFAGGAIGYFSSIAVSRRQNRNIAAEKFRNAFSDEILRLEQGTEDVFKVLSDDAYLKHQKAKIEYEPYLRNSAKHNLNKAWDKYHKYRNSDGQSVAPGSTTVRKREVEKAKNVLEDLIAVARPS